MQSVIVVVLIIIMGFYALMESKRNDMAAAGKIEAFKAENVAGNIMQYSDMLTQYVEANYANLHDNYYTQMNNVAHVTMLDYNDNHISDYSQKNLDPFLNYTSSLFNYGVLSQEDAANSQLATLYLVISFSNYQDNLPGYKKISLDRVMGALSQRYSRHVYQGDSNSWVVPLLLKQDEVCNVVEIFGQVPNSSNGVKQRDAVSMLFNRMCTQLQKQGYTMQKYVYIAPVYETGD